LLFVKKLFTQWVKVKQKQKQYPEETDDDNLNQMKTARDCLQQMFADRLHYDSIEKLMSTATSPTDQKILKQLSAWTTSMHQRFVSPGKTSIQFESSTPENLIEQYHPFTKEVVNASFQGRALTCSPGPPVNIVRHDYWYACVWRH
jgi:hypothetical protein